MSSTRVAEPLYILQLQAGKRIGCLLRVMHILGLDLSFLPILHDPENTLKGGNVTIICHVYLNLNNSSIFHQSGVPTPSGTKHVSILTRLSFDLPHE